MTSSEYKKITALISEIGKGNKASFSEIYSMFEKKVYFLCCKITGSKSVSASITVETFAYVFKNITRISNIALFDKWVYFAATSRCKAYFKKIDESKYEEHTDSDEEPTDDIDAVLAIDAQKNVKNAGNFEINVDKMKATDRLIAQLPQKIRIAFIHYYFSGLSFEEIAQYESISINAVKNRILYARIKLQASVNEAIAAGEDLRGLIPAMSYMLETMAESVVVPQDISMQVSAQIGVTCLSNDMEYDAGPEFVNSQPVFSNNNVSGVNLNPSAQRNRDGGYKSAPSQSDEEADDDYYDSDDEEKIRKIHKATSMTPTVKILIGVICVLVLVIGSIIIAVVEKNNKNTNEPSSSGIEEFEGERLTTKKKEKTTKPTTEKPTVFTTAATTAPTTQATTAPTTEATTAPTTEATTEATTAPTTAATEPTPEDDEPEDDEQLEV